MASDFPIPATLDSESPAQSPSALSASAPRILLRVPTSFPFSAFSVDGNLLYPLPPEIGLADFSIAPDGSFVETSSGPAVRELKRRYDRDYGVNLSVRSPYAITASYNQHGGVVYRVGKRKNTTPAAGAVCVDADKEDHSPDQAPPKYSET
ncbi:hypothetical protein B0H13DRAFT_2315480 [Mycena leptocephala]|nr:hypothetical protein B0H13DRAFT_2315480 [Mycena leptocephala]